MSPQPEYVRFESKERDELLSQIGTFSPAERSLFERLCAAWQPRLDVTLLLKRASSVERELAALERLFTKLRAAQIGLLIPNQGDPALPPSEVILTSSGSLDFWRELVDLELSRIIASDSGRLPSEKLLTDRNALPPAYHITDISSTELADAYSADVDSDAIDRIRLLGDYRIIFAARSAKRLVSTALQTFRTDLTERGLIDEIARIRNSTLHETSEQLKGKTPDAWMSITQAVIKERKSIAFRKNIDERDEIFQIAYLIMIFVEAQMGAARRRVETDGQLDAEITAVVSAVSTSPDGMVSHEQFETLINEAVTRLGPDGVRLSQRLSDKVLKPRPRRSLPVVLYLHGLYIHCDRLLTTCNSAKLEVAERLTREYTDLLEAFLRGRPGEVTETLGSRDRLNEDLRIRVERTHPLLGEILARPQLLAEAVIHDARLRDAAAGPDDLKHALAVYFDVETSQLRPLTELLGLNVVEILDSAYRKISVFRQILLRLSGRHESLRQTYERRFGPRRSDSRPKPDADEPARQRGGRTDLAPSEEPAGMRVRGTGNRGHTPETQARVRRASPKGAPAPKPRSHREIDAVWQEFGKAIHTKPKPDASEEDAP